jgi:hypothetical protein
MLARMERSDMMALMQQQKEDEDKAVDKMDSSDEDEEVEEEEDEEEEEEQEDQEEEEEEDENDDQEKGNGSFVCSTRNRKRLSGKEKDFLREQFVNDMYWSFLEGKDKDFDYRLVLWEYTIICKGVGRMSSVQIVRNIDHKFVVRFRVNDTISISHCTLQIIVHNSNYC